MVEPVAAQSDENDVTFLRDAVGVDTVAAYEVAVRLNYPLIGNGVLTVVEFSTR